MNRDELLRALRKIARKDGLAVQIAKTKGKGSHAKIFYGERSTICPDGELKTPTLKGVLAQLGLTLDDLRK